MSGLELFCAVDDFSLALTQHNLHLITPARRNMQGHLISHLDALLLRKRAIIESIHDQLKNMRTEPPQLKAY